MNKPSAIQILIAFTAILICAQSAFSADIIRESVRRVISESADNSSVEVLISFEGELDLTALKINRMREKRDRAANYRDVMYRLNRNRTSLEKSILTQLEEMKAAGLVESYKFYTVSKTVLVKTRVDNIENLANLPGARLVNLNHEVSLINPVEEKDTDVFSKLATINSALDAVNARTLWDRGLTGAGRLICSFDTGIDGEHPALGPKWRGNNGGTAAESWYAPRGAALPYDNIGHGSHVMGVMVGSDGADTIGVAPGAQWISAAVVDQGVSLSTTLADILSAFDWVLNPDGDINTLDDLPDVICNSWGVPRGILGDCDNMFWTAIDNVEAAGIVTIFAAGNEGPNPMSIRNPADRSTSPLNTLSVGAVDPNTLVVADFSSRGPASCDGVSIKPELTAPGVSIYSTYKDGGYKVMSGTSMATPFVAGLVALMRQYNPEATVEEIKNALLMATVDLGPAGEDNAYGHGMIDASRILDYLSAPDMPSITVYNHDIYSNGDSFADPGEIAEITLTLNEPTALVDSVDVWVSSNSQSVSVSPEVVRYYFAHNATYSVSLNPFYLQISPDAVSGSSAELMVHFGYMNGVGEDSVVYTISLGHELPGNLYEINSGDMKLTSSDFGQFGFGFGSIYQAGGDGLIFGASSNLLYEAGLVIGRNQFMVSDGIRGFDGRFKVSDFVPDGDVIPTAAGLESGITSSYSDGNADLPIPVQIRQTVYGSSQNYAIIQIDAVNQTASDIDDLAVGLFWDFEISRHNDRVGFDSLMGMFYHYNVELGTYVGLVGVSANEFAFTAAQNGPDSKQGFSIAEKYDMAAGYGINIEDGDAGDWYCMVSRTTGRIQPFATSRTAIVITTGATLEQMRAAAQSGMNEYNLYLDIEEEWAALPVTMELSQNYPNPFNPQTTIEFAVGSTQHATLTVYNVTGQKVRTLFDETAQAGKHSVVWDGCDDYGQNVASGIYFYRLTSDEETQSRKMVFLK